ncbi:hypoxia up-regulated protein 1-like [Mizuhopecten yessoensis]|uniref:hypoxia up-regulated protein 1-like n=1 Tax=Mizuhopecten yessoensis TaxID=6573 RepID=UPI000B45A6AD|nr:hypoxia up-regulated protein 1-like [Mizuhopecten yessoensis]
MRMVAVSRPGQLLVITTVLCLYVSLTVGFNLAVIAIDLGAEYTKIALVKPGVPMEIVLNDEGSRKTSSIVAMRDGERHYGQAATNTGVRFPKKAFWYLMHIVGLKYEDPQVETYRKRFPYYNIIKDEDRGTMLFQLEDDSTYSPEELIAMLLEKAKANAELFADQPIKDCVITVPAYFSQPQRKAMIQAASMVDLNILQIMSDNAAVALNYGVFRRKMFNSTMQYYMFYDMGATSTTATVVGYQLMKIKEGTRVETNPQLVIKGVGYDRNLGGLEITLRMQDHLAKAFTKTKKTKSDVYQNARAMAKLFKEAERVKKVLSANNDHFAQVEGLLDEEDFRVKVSRDELEGMTLDLMERVTKPIEDALKASQVTLPELTEIILFGGGTRTPKVQTILSKFLGGQELGKSINSDEAAALGAVYQAAHLGKGFKVKTFGIKEGTIFPISVEFAKQTVGQDDSAGKPKTVKRTLFSRMNPFPQKKVMTFNKHTKDFTFNVTYSDLSFLSDEEVKSLGSPVLATYTVTGVDTAYSKHAEDAESKGVKAHFRLDESGILHMDKAEVIFERQGPPEEESTWSKIGSTLGGLFGSSADKDVKVEDTDPGTEADNSDSTDSNGEREATKAGKSDEQLKKDDLGEDKSSDKDEKSEKEQVVNHRFLDNKKANKTTLIKEELTSEYNSYEIPQLSADQFKHSKNKLADLTAKDKEKKLLEKAKNDLEAFIFEMGDRLSRPMYEKCSTEMEREEYSKVLSESSDWMYEQDDDAKKEIYTEKLRELKKMTKDLEMRVRETKERPEALKALESMLNHSVYFLQTVQNLSQVEEPIFTEVEVTTLGKLINDTINWKNDTVKEQKKMLNTEKPKLLVQDIGMKIQALDREVKYLINKAKNFRPKAKPKAKKNTTSAANNTAANETKSTDDKTDPLTQEGRDNKDSDEPADDTGSKNTAKGTTTPEEESELPLPPTEEESELPLPPTEEESELPLPPTVEETTKEEEVLQPGDVDDTLTTTTTTTTTEKTTEKTTTDKTLDSTTKSNKHDGSDL